MKNLLLILPLLIVGCAINPPLLIDFRDPNTKYGDWHYSTSTDEFNGDFLLSLIRNRH